MAVTDLADVAAAQSAGYRLIQIDRGAAPTGKNFNANQPPRYRTHIERQMLGAAGDSGFLFQATGESNVSQAAADAQALASLNDMRQHRYGGAGGRASGDAESVNAKGATLVVDVS
jgi:hypothetical protein